MAPIPYNKQDLRKTRLSRSHPVIKVLPGDLEDHLTNSFLDRNSDAGSELSDVRSVMIVNDLDYEEDEGKVRFHTCGDELDKFQALSMSFYEKRVEENGVDRRSLNPFSMGSRLSPKDFSSSKKHDLNSPEKKFININSVYLRKPIQGRPSVNQNQSAIEKNSLFSINENRGSPNKKKAMLLSPKIQQKGLLKTERSSIVNPRNAVEDGRKEIGKKREEKTTSEENRHIINKLEAKLKNNNRDKASAKRERGSNETRDVRKEKSGVNLIVSMEVDRASYSLRETSLVRRGNEGDLSMRSPNGHCSPTAKIHLRKNLAIGNVPSKKTLRNEYEKESSIPTKLIELKKTLLKNISQASTQNTTVGSIVVKDGSLFESFEPKVNGLLNNAGSNTKRVISKERNNTKERAVEVPKKNNQIVGKLPLHKLQGNSNGVSGATTGRDKSNYGIQLLSSRSEREVLFSMIKKDGILTEKESNIGAVMNKQNEIKRDKTKENLLGSNKVISLSKQTKENMGIDKPVRPKISVNRQNNNVENRECSRNTPNLFKAPIKSRPRVLDQKDKGNLSLVTLTENKVESKKCQEMKENKQEYGLCTNCGSCMKNNPQGKIKTFRLD